MASERAPKIGKKSWWPFVVRDIAPPETKFNVKAEEKAAASEARIRITRPTRIPFDPIRGACIILQFKDQEPLKLEVMNLSSHGLGMACARLASRRVEAGSVYEGEISFGAHRFNIAFRIVHITRGVAGCVFVHRNELYIQAFSKWFAAEIAAARLRRMNQLILKEEPDGKPIYYFGDGNELFIVEAANPPSGERPKLLRFHAMILGNYFEAEENRNLKYGHAFIDARGGDALSYKGSELIRYSSEVPKEMTDLFGRFIESVTDLESWHRAALLAILKR